MELTPEIEPAELARIAARRPDLQAEVARHPNAYDELLDWLAQYGTEDAKLAVAERRAAEGHLVSAERAVEVPPILEGRSGDEPRADQWQEVDESVARPEGSSGPREIGQRKAPSRRQWFAFGALAGVVLVAAAVWMGVSNARAAEEAQAVADEAAKQHEISLRNTKITIRVVTDSGVTAAGILVRVTGDDYSDQVTVTSAGNGTVVVGAAGSFVVTLDKESMPEGYSLLSDASQTVYANLGVTSPVTFEIDAPDPEPTEEPEVAPPAPKAQWSFATSAGYSYDLDIQVGHPTASGANGKTTIGTGLDATSTPNNIGAGCTDFDPSTDIAVPLVITLRPTTAGFDTPMKASFRVEHVPAADEPRNATPPESFMTAFVVSEQFYSTGPECTDWGRWTNTTERVNVLWNEGLAAGSRGVFNMTVIVKNYKTPNHPGGDPAILDWLSIAPIDSATAVDSVGIYTRQSGPKAVTLSGKVVE